MRLLISLIVLTASVGLTGCGPRRVRVDFVGYEKSYAHTSNREVLLNLARLQQHDPTYFFKLGQISSTYQMQAGLSGFGQYVPQGSNTGIEVPTGGGTPTAAYQNYSAFNFVPVSDEANARVLLSPVPSEVFYDLYYQGWRVDQLFRLMVDRIELTLPADREGKTCVVKVIRNAPPPVFRYKSGSGDNYETSIDYAHEQSAIVDYVTFLRVSAIVYALQKYGMLQLRGASRFEPLDKNSSIEVKAANSSAGEQTLQVPGHENVVVIMPGGKPETGGNSAAPAAKDFVDAAAKGQVWELQTMPDGTKGWLLGQNVNFLEFQLISSPLQLASATETTSGNNTTETASGKMCKPETIFGDNVSDTDTLLRTEIIPKDESLQGLQVAPELMDILEILSRGFSIEVPSAEEQNEQGVCPKDWHEGAPSRLVMRSLIGVMAASAQEQEAFDQLKADSDKHPLRLTEGSPLIKMVTATHNGLMILDNNTPPRTAPVIENPLYQKLMNGLEAKQQATFNQLVPSIEQLPVLRLNWTGFDPDSPRPYPPPVETAEELKDTGLSLNYGHRDFLVTDADLAQIGSTGYARENQSWNRDMFRLICSLSSQVTVDISKFPLPAILQLPIQ